MGLADQVQQLTQMDVLMQQQQQLQTTVAANPNVAVAATAATTPSPKPSRKGWWECEGVSGLLGTVQTLY